jgi:Holliday junction resolvase RusA-like endonuclease
MGAFDDLFGPQSLTDDVTPPLRLELQLAEPPKPARAERFEFFVAGDPQAKGDKIILHGGGKSWLAERNSGPKAQWRARAADIARQARGDHAPFDCAVRVRLEVLRQRPKGHFGTGRKAGVLKATAPPLPTSSPDLDKLQRSLGDALNGVMWRDDALISTWIVTRRWSTEAGMRVVVEPDVVEGGV